MSGPFNAVHNILLAALPPASLASVMAKLTPVPLNMRQELIGAGGQVGSAFFPQTGMISLVAPLADGTQAEVGLIGREGMLGVSLLTDIDTSFCELIVQRSGTALRMSAGDLRAEIAVNAPLRTVLLRYYEALHAQAMQTAACNGRHGLVQRLSRWLLMAHDRAETAELPLTQEFLSMMLGVRRPSVTVTAGILQRAGSIKYASGVVTILDRAALEASSCECYGAVKKRFGHLLEPGASHC